MSKKKTQAPAPVTEEFDAAVNDAAEEAPTEAAEAKPESRQKEEAAEDSGSLVYCGPSIKGVARQYSVYSNGIPNALKALVNAHPVAKALIVPLERFAETRLKLEQKGSAESIIYNAFKSEL